MTYTEYQSRMQEVQSQVDEVSPSGPEQVDGATKLGVWVEVAGDKSRGRCYGIADMSSHIQRENFFHLQQGDALIKFFSSDDFFTVLPFVCLPSSASLGSSTGRRSQQVPFFSRLLLLQ
ncbi:hypothetical protein SESBI_21458 [Sesbania bispinosa]|nr:hypothetical protein SESBI_21458 [Sesbania bispinosa]